MKDLVENRKRITLPAKLKLAGLAFKENGAWWCTLLVTYLAASALAHRAFSSMDRLRRTRNLPGLNSAGLNKGIWEAWDWSAAGEEWTGSQEAKQSLIRCILQRYVPENSSILEIGPGAGRWTPHLLERAREYIGVDISSSCVDHCRKRFGDISRARFFVGSGRDLEGVADTSIEAIWSYDVFVHINSAEVDSYLREFVRVLEPGGLAVIHHGAVGGASGGWRSNLTAAVLSKMAQERRLRIEGSFGHWIDGDEVHQLSYGDLITVLRKDAA